MEEQKNVDASKVAKALKKFLCFLYVGNDRPYYDATKFYKKEDYYAEGKHMRNLEILVSDENHRSTPLDKIKLAMDSELVRNPDTLMFALAMCARQKRCEKLRTDTYYFVAEHCKEWKLFIRFVAFAAFLCKVENPNEDEKAKEPTGSGRGWKRAVNEWYLEHNTTDLAILTSRYKSAYGIRHRDILRLSHIDILNADVEKQVVLAYAIDGLHAASKRFKNEPEALKQLNYLIQVEKFRSCQDPSIVSQLICEMRDLTIDHVHPNALKNEAVWQALLVRMDVRTVLEYIPRISQLGLLKRNSTLTETVVKILENEYNLRWGKVLPAEISNVLNRYDAVPQIHTLRRTRVNNVEYEESGAEEIVALTPASQALLDKIIIKWEIEREERERKEKIEKRTEENKEKLRKMELLKEKMKGWEITEGQKEVEDRKARKKANRRRMRPLATKKEIKKERKKKEPVAVKAPNKHIRNALKAALNLSLKVDITRGSEKRYAVAIKMPPRNPKKTSCLEVGLTLALPLANRKYAPEDATTIIFHDPASDWGFVMKENCINCGFDDIMKKSLSLAKEPENWCAMGVGSPTHCIRDAIEREKAVDVFINVTTLPPTRPAPFDAERTKKSLRSLPYIKTHIFPASRFVNILLNKAPFELKGEEWDEILTIRGFNATVPFIIEAYVRQLF